MERGESRKKIERVEGCLNIMFELRGRLIIGLKESFSLKLLIRCIYNSLESQILTSSVDLKHFSRYGH